MKSNLIALAITALVGGMLVLPLTHQSAMAQAYAGLKGLGSTGGVPTSGTNNDRGDVILVGRGGRGGGHGGGRGGGRSFGGGGHYGKAFSGGGRGGGKAYRGGGHRGGHYAYRGGRSHYAHRGGYGSKSRHYAYRGGKHYDGKHYRNYGKGRYRYYRYGRWWYAPYVTYGYGYGNCEWLRRQALITGSQYWWDRYYDCIY